LQRFYNTCYSCYSVLIKPDIKIDCVYFKHAISMMKNTLDIFACFINTLSHILIILIHAVKPVLCTLAIVKGMRKKY
jgi:hypothetical protein